MFTESNLRALPGVLLSSSARRATALATRGWFGGSIVTVTGSVLKWMSPAWCNRLRVMARGILGPGSIGSDWGAAPLE